MCQDTDYDYEAKDNYVYSLSDRKKLEDELSALGRIGYYAEFCENIPIPVQAAGAVRFSSQAQFNPLKFLAETVKCLKVYENTFIKELRGNTAVTDKGRIEAKAIIVATHFPFINRHGSYFLKLYQHRSYVMALENAQDVNGMYVDECRTGLSFSNYGKYLLLGGGGHRTGNHGGSWTEFRDFAKRHYPSAKEFCYWAAQDCMSLDDMPYIGRYSASTLQLYTASGFNKWGMTGAMLSAIMLSDMVYGKRNEYEEILTPSRSILRPQLLINGFETMKNMLTFTTRRCPHLGCALKWSRALMGLCLSWLTS